MSLGVVIRRDGINSEVFGYLQLITILHDLARAKHIGAALVGNKASLIASQHLDGLLVKMVKVFVSH